uniref:Secreted protein n=1 Tax=Heterorhabditis bacteriophora TaxID=37862 RepID=A0A1I7WWT3_HETBA
MLDSSACTVTASVEYALFIPKRDGSDKQNTQSAACYLFESSSTFYRQKKCRNDRRGTPKCKAPLKMGHATRPSADLLY